MNDRSSPEPIANLIVLDLYGCRPGSVSDMTMRSRFVDALKDHLGLGQDRVTINSVEAANFISIDVYYFGKLHSGKVLRCARKTFEPRDVEMRKIARGRKSNG